MSGPLRRGVPNRVKKLGKKYKKKMVYLLPGNPGVLRNRLNHHGTIDGAQPLGGCMAGITTTKGLMNIIARIHTDCKTKFGIPRQSGLVQSLKGTIIFTPVYRNADAVRGLDGFSHIWLIWQFSAAIRDQWSPTVRPPRLGGDKRMGVFATRSPFRPNPIGLSSVKLDHIELHSTLGPILQVSGVDLLDNTPIFDIKPYLAYTDSHPDAADGFTQSLENVPLTVDFPPQQIALIHPEHRQTLIDLLASDPRPRYQEDPQRLYGFEFAQWNIQFKVRDKVLTVYTVTPL